VKRSSVSPAPPLSPPGSLTSYARVAPWIGAALVCFVLAALTDDLGFVRSTTTYGNFDVPSDRAGIEALAPGVPDLARKRVYRFTKDVPVHETPLIALGLVFAIFLAIRVTGGVDKRMGIRRGFVQWSSFVLARIGVARAANAIPVARCTFGVFPFLNCQYCEMASGACPVGVVQSAITRGRFPFFAVGVVTAVGATLGRWICGWFCPFGLFLDMCERGGRKKPVHIPHKLRLGKFVMLGLVVVGAAGFGLLGIDVVSWFCATICPAGSLYGLVPYYGTTAVSPFTDAIVHFDASNGGHWLVWGHLAFFAAFLFVTFRYGARLFCSVACPLGAALGLFARFSLVRVVHVEEGCTKCGACVKVCPMGIDLANHDALTVSDCIQCTRCINVCATGGREWSFKLAARAANAPPPVAAAATGEKTSHAPA
jgi:ferredoxin-type protein NapH